MTDPWNNDENTQYPPESPEQMQDDTDATQELPDGVEDTIKDTVPAEAINAEAEGEGEGDEPLILEAPAHPIDLTFTGLGDGVTRPLSAELVNEIIAGDDHATFGQGSNTGITRSNNEDAVFSFFATNRSSEEVPDFGLFIVADGMGGHHDGEKASAMAARSVANYVLKNMYLPLLTGTFNTDVPINEALEEAIQRANSEIVAEVPDGGTTTTVAVVIGDVSYLAHVGDSRAYLITRNNIEQLTRDHSLVQRLIELDHITPEEANEYPNKNVLYRALGQNESLEVDTLRRKLPPLSRLLLCSDGLWSQVHEKEIVDIVNHAPTPQDACNQLILLANQRGGIDNVTVTILQLPR